MKDHLTFKNDFLNVFDMQSVNSSLFCLFNEMQKFSYNANIHCEVFREMTPISEGHAQEIRKGSQNNHCGLHIGLRFEQVLWLIYPL